MYVHLNKNYVLLKNEHKVQNLHIKEMLSNAYKKIIQNFLVHIKKLLKKLFDRIRTKPSSQSMLRNRHDSSVPNVKCFKWDIKEKTIYLDLAYFQHKN